MKFLPYKPSDFHEVLSLLQASFEDNRQAFNFQSLGGDYASPCYQRFVIKDGDKIIAYLAFCTRVVRYLDQYFTSASIGPVAVATDAQGKGVGRHLMVSTIDHLSLQGIEFAYIQGIPHYYQKFGFIKYLDKIKRIVPTATTHQADPAIIVVEENCRDIALFKSLYDSYSAGVNFSARRSEDDWRWLITHASDTYYFHHPKVIRDADGAALGYFCEDPFVPDSPRELVLVNSREGSGKAIAALKAYYASRGLGRFELKAPESSLSSEILDSEGCERIVQDNPHGGDLLFVLDELKSAKKLGPSIERLLRRLDYRSQVKIPFDGFAIHFDGTIKDPKVFVEETSDASGIRFVDFISGRMNEKQCNLVSAASPHRYAATQDKIFGPLKKFVFQGDNM